MTLIELFTDHVVNCKSLKEYVEIRKNIHERGEFNDRTLIQAEEDLQRLRREHPDVYAGMYEILYEIMRRDEGHYFEYPINFIRQILRIYQDGIPAEKVLAAYRSELDHHYRDAC
ncbi:hypothetical protein ACXWTF_01655 [Thiomicrolovo sp. ZZH C-3]